MTILNADLRYSDREVLNAQILERDISAQTVRWQQYMTWRRYPPGHALHVDMNRKHSLSIVGQYRENISKGRTHLFEGKPVMGDL